MDFYRILFYFIYTSVGWGSKIKKEDLNAVGSKFPLTDTLLFALKWVAPPAIRLSTVSPT